MVSGIPSGTAPLPALPVRHADNSATEATVNDTATSTLASPGSSDDQLALNANLAVANFNPDADAQFPDLQAAPPLEEVPELPSLDEPVTGVLRGEALEGRLKALQQEIGTQLEGAQGRHEKALENLQQYGFHNDLLNDVLKHQHAIDMLTQMQVLLQRGEHDAVRQLQQLVKSSAISEATGSGIGVDNQYGPTSDRLLVERIREPDSTYVDRDFSYRPEGAFVYQYGEVGEGGTAMEAQANCGPASMAMLIQRLGGAAPSMQQIRQEAGAPTGNRPGTYGLDSDQVERGLQNVLAEQGIQVDTETQIFSSRQSEAVINAMREALAAGEQVMLLTANLESGGQGHYVVVTEIREDGSMVVDDPQSEAGQGRVYTPEELAAGMRRRGGYGRDTRVITMGRASDS